VALAQWPAFLARQGVDLALSRVAMAGGKPHAFCLVAPRPDTGSWRLATMGAVPVARGTGTAPALLDDFITRGAATGAAAVELECFAQNTRALRLYEGRGFALVDALYGHERDAAPINTSASADVVDRDDALAWLDACGCALPLQVTPRSLRALPGELLARRRGGAVVLFTIAPNQRLQVHSLVDRDAAQHDAQALIAALLAEWPGHSLHVPQLQRQAVGGAALDRLGCRRLPLHQVWLRRRV
jgi:hypothetical protein